MFNFIMLYVFIYYWTLWVSISQSPTCCLQNAWCMYTCTLLLVFWALSMFCHTFIQWHCKNIPCIDHKLIFTCSLVQFFYTDTSSPLIREIVQLRRMLVGELGSSKTKGPAFGSVSASAAVMLTPWTFLFTRSQIWDSLGMSAGGLSLISIR